MSTFRATDAHGGHEVSVRVTTFGAKTDDPCVIVHCGPMEALTTDPEGFFEQVAAAKAAWDSRAGAQP